MIDEPIKAFDSVHQLRQSKKDLLKVNEILEFYLSYIEYRSKMHWRGRDSSYIECDLQNILIRMRNDLITKQASF